MGRERKEYRFRGRVQGVGFRATAQQIARGLGLSGFARNLDDGTVEVVAEGSADAHRLFVEKIRQAMGPRIQGFDTLELDADPSTSDTGDFDIRS